MAVTQPRAGVPIGFVEVGGRRVPVLVDPEYLRFFSSLGTGVNTASDHGSLTGLSDDDHPQYLNNARGDARYAPLSSAGHTIEDEGTPLTQRTSLNFTGSGVSVADSGGKTVVTVTAGGNSVTVACDFGASFTDKAQTVVTGQAWVTANSEITAQVLTPSGVDPDEIRLLDLRPVVSDLVVGVGFTVTLYSTPEAKGSYDVMCIGV